MKKLKQIAILLTLSAGILLTACDTDRYANQSTVTVSASENPDIRKALVSKLNALNFDYEITKKGEIRYPRKNQADFEAILAQVTQEQQTAGQ